MTNEERFWKAEADAAELRLKMLRKEFGLDPETAGPVASGDNDWALVMQKLQTLTEERDRLREELKSEQGAYQMARRDLESSREVLRTERDKVACLYGELEAAKAELAKERALLVNESARADRHFSARKTAEAEWSRDLAERDRLRQLVEDIKAVRSVKRPPLFDYTTRYEDICAALDSAGESS